MSDPARLNVLYEDNHLLVVNKPAGLLVQGDRTGDTTLAETAKEYIKGKYHKPGRVYLGIVQRIDRPASGVILLARTSKAARRLSRQFQQHSPRKYYWALVSGQVPRQEQLIDYITRNGPTSHITSNRSRGKYAELHFKRLKFKDNISWVGVELLTGRHHQIRIQFAHRGHPLLGDFRYGSSLKFPQRAIALHARSLTITHPIKKERLTFIADPAPFWPANFREEQ